MPSHRRFVKEHLPIIKYHNKHIRVDMTRTNQYGRVLSPTKELCQKETRPSNRLKKWQKHAPLKKEAIESLQRRLALTQAATSDGGTPAAAATTAAANATTTTTQSKDAISPPTLEAGAAASLAVFPKQAIRDE